MTFDKAAAEFWDKKEPRVMGDIRARPNVLNLLGDIKGKKILDAGCGTGYMSRMLAKEGAKVYGIDESEFMIEKADRLREKNFNSFQFNIGNVAFTGYQSNFFDAGILVGVLMYEKNPNSVINEMSRVIKPEGKLVVSVTHPYLYQEGSPATKFSIENNWLELYNSNKKLPNRAGIFKQYYIDKEGNVSESEVYDHSIPLYFNSLSNSGFRIERVNEILVRKKDLLHPLWGKSSGYPAYLQILAKKEKK